MTRHAVDPARAAVGSTTPANPAPQDLRVTSDVGRHARLHLAFERREGRTRLASSYAEPPFRVPTGFPDGNAGLHAILASSAPGIFGGDRFAQTIEMRSGARVRLTSQSAPQVHPSHDNAVACVEAHYTIETGAHLHCEWDPVIPFAGASLDQRSTIDLAGNATLFWSDAIMAGRQAHGERWAFARLAHELRVCRDGRLVYLERYAIEGGASVSRTWIADDACYFGTVLIVGPRGSTSPEEVHGELNRMVAVRASVDALDRDVLLARLISASGTAFHAARGRVLRAGRECWST